MSRCEFREPIFSRKNDISNELWAFSFLQNGGGEKGNLYQPSGRISAWIGGRFPGGLSLKRRECPFLLSFLIYNFDNLDLAKQNRALRA